MAVLVELVELAELLLSQVYLLPEVMEALEEAEVHIRLAEALEGLVCPVQPVVWLRPFQLTVVIARLAVTAQMGWVYPEVLDKPVLRAFLV